MPRRQLLASRLVGLLGVCAACGAPGGAGGPGGHNRQSVRFSAEVVGGGPAAGPAARDTAAGARTPETYFAKNFWFEIPTESHPGDVWQTAYCDRTARAGSRITPSTPAASVYGAGVPAADQPTAQASALASALGGAVAKASAGRSATPRRDPELDALARALAPMVSSSGRLPARLVEFMMRHRGMVEPMPEVLVMWGPVFDPAKMVAQLEPELPAIFDVAPFNALGIGSADRDDLGAGVVVMVFQTRYVDLAPFPRELATAGRRGRRGASGDTRAAAATLSGTVRAPYTSPEVEVIRDNGDRLTPKLVRGGARGFRAALSCGRYRGRQRVIVRASRSAGLPGATGAGAVTEVVASVPVYCGTSAPTSTWLTGPGGPGRGDSAAPMTAADVERYVARAINRERRACGLPPLRVHPRLSAVARAHSEEQAAGNRLAHHSARTGTARDRVRRAGVHSSSAREFLVRAYDLREVTLELLDSFEFRAAVLSPEDVVLGLGALVRPSGSGTELFFTQLVARIPGAHDADQVHRVIDAKLRRRRSLVRDSALSASADALARELAAGVAAEAAVDRATLALRREKTKFADARFLVWALADAESFTPGQALDEPDISHYGSAVVRAASGAAGVDTFHVVVIVGTLQSGLVKDPYTP